MKQNSFLLLQIRDNDDPMRRQEIKAFAKNAGCSSDEINTCDLLEADCRTEINQAELVFIGGSGSYGVVGDEAWLTRALSTMRYLYDIKKPTFASCWGFQALVKAMGGEVVTDLNQAELGTPNLNLTREGKDDPIFKQMPDSFPVVEGHKEIAIKLPSDAVLLASTSQVKNQALRFKGRPIWATQFHTEINLRDLIERVEAYPEYLEKITGESVEEFKQRVSETTDAATLPKKFVNYIATS